MESERNEVYERIPWEHLDKQGSDRQWLLVGLAGAVALGALAYSFMKNQPVESVAAAPTVEQPVTAEAPPSTVVRSLGATTTVASPVVISEADLYAIDAQQLADVASTHAEWFAVEYFSVDGSTESSETLLDLLPEGVPLPEAPAGTQVFVDWVGTQRIVQIGDFDFAIEVLVRSLVSTPENGFTRQPVRLIEIEVSLGVDGEPRIISAPVVLEAAPASSGRLELTEIPEEVRVAASTSGDPVGGILRADGSWRVLVMSAGTDGVTRPVMIDVP
jgi:hypothetical protein